MPFLAPPDTLPRPPQRIVSLVPSLTELLHSLRLGPEVVGLTRFCVHPAGWKQEKTIVGGTKNVNVERVRALAPDLVIATKEENVREEVEAIAAFAPVLLADIATLDDALDAIRRIGDLVHRATEADRLATVIAEDLRPLADAEPVRALYLIWRDPWMSVGRDTFIADAMRRTGLVSVTENRTRYPTLSSDEIRALAPEAVLLSSEPYPFAEKHLAEVQTLVPQARVVLVDGEAFSWYGPRLRALPGAVRDLRQHLAPTA
ncbi:MAG: helical backbone metal receptor [Bacteroidota bacterium]